MTRTPQQTFADGRRLATGDLDLIAGNHTADAVLITPAGTFRGHDGVRRVIDGIDTYAFRDGPIAAQTVRYTLTERADRTGGPNSLGSLSSPNSPNSPRIPAISRNIL
ncbi:nuclear transport factor 2 family protein [Embleya sp. NPDC056575]|uniref:nuclear transport factor 2 family protein n=1 Tax=unclassified Embleya TaxID=2699296 RepID=UPI0036ACC6EB